MHSSEYKKLIKVNLWVYGAVFALVFIIGLIFDINNSFLPIILAYLSASYMPLISLNALLASKSRHRRHHHHKEGEHRSPARFPWREMKMLPLQLLLLALVYGVIYRIFGNDPARTYAWCSIGLIGLTIVFRIFSGDPFRKKSKGGMDSKDYYYLYNGIGTLLSLGFCFLYYYRFLA